MLTLRKGPCDEALILTAAATDESRCAVQARPWVLAATILGSSLAFIDGSVVNVALPAIQDRLEASLFEMQWVVNAYTLFLAALILFGGAAGDRFGRRRVFAAGIVAFTLASIWCGLAADVEQLITARALQGIGGALLIPNSLAIISAAFPENERGRAIGTWAGFSALTTALGPVLGGWLVDAVSWRAIFLINVPLAVIAILITLRHVPESRASGRQAALDGIGTVLVVIALAAMSYGLISAGEQGWDSSGVIFGLLAGFVLLIVFLWWEAHSRTPMMPLGLFASGTFSGANLMTLFLYFALSGAFFLLPYNLMQAQGYSAAATGAAFLPFTLILAGLSRWSGGLIDRFGAKPPLVIGPIIAAAGLALLTVPDIGGSYWLTFFPGFVVLGFGMAISVAPLSTTVMNAVDDEHAGIASGINNAVSRVSTLLAVALLGALAVSLFQQTLAAQMSSLQLPAALTDQIMLASDRLADIALPDTLADDVQAALQTTIAQALVSSYRRVMLVAAACVLIGAACALLLIREKQAAADA